MLWEAGCEDTGSRCGPAVHQPFLFGACGLSAYFTASEELRTKGSCIAINILLNFNGDKTESCRVWGERTLPLSVLCWFEELGPELGASWCSVQCLPAMAKVRHESGFQRQATLPSPPPNYTPPTSAHMHNAPDYELKNKGGKGEKKKKVEIATQTPWSFLQY